MYLWNNSLKMNRSLAERPCVTNGVIKISIQIEMEGKQLGWDVGHKERTQKRISWAQRSSRVWWIQTV